MNIYQFGRILLINSLLIIAVNGLCYWLAVKSLDQGTTLILIGFACYMIQLITTYVLLEKQKLWLVQPFQGKHVLQALGATVIVQMLTVCLVTGLTYYSQIAFLSNHALSFWPVFVLHSLPGALMEEWLFRYLPFRFGQQSEKRYQPILFCLGMLVPFSLIHIPVFLQYEIGLAGLGQVFMMGAFFLIVYLLTRNLCFTALFHGLTNKLDLQQNTGQIFKQHVEVAQYNSRKGKDSLTMNAVVDDYTAAAAAKFQYIQKQPV